MRSPLLRRAGGLEPLRRLMYHVVPVGLYHHSRPYLSTVREVSSWRGAQARHQAAASMVRNGGRHRRTASARSPAERKQPGDRLSRPVVPS